ncbi:hypothetical protein INR49_013023 [Caranx melampygus]|nr:hypothetical protein INR49_013023 [Caranx melampygus]
MESGACAVGAGLLQPQTGRPVTKHCTAQGLTTTTATGIDIRKNCQRDNNTDTPEYSHGKDQWSEHWRRKEAVWLSRMDSLKVGLDQVVKQPSLT